MRTILIAEDNLVYLRQLVESLQPYRDELDILTAENGREALNLLVNQPVDIVITDLNMPIMDGFELLAQLRQQRSGMPAIVLTGMTRPDVLATLAEYGDLRVLHKPVQHEALMAAIREALDKVFRGSSQGVTLANMLQLLSLDRRTCSILVESGGRRGSLHFVSGDLVDAYVFDEQLAGEAAASELLAWADAKLELRDGLDKTSRDRYVETPLGALLENVYTKRSAGETVPVPGKFLAERNETPESESVASETATRESDPSTEQTMSDDKERPMADIRTTLADEAEALQDTFKRLQMRAQEADSALEAVMAEFATFREQQARYQQAESAYLERQQRLEQLREGAEALAQQLLSVVKQVDDDSPEAAPT